MAELKDHVDMLARNQAEICAINKDNQNKTHYSKRNHYNHHNTAPHNRTPTCNACGKTDHNFSQCLAKTKTCNVCDKKDHFRAVNSRNKQTYRDTRLPVVKEGTAWKGYTQNKTQFLLQITLLHSTNLDIKHKLSTMIKRETPNPTKLHQ